MLERLVIALGRNLRIKGTTRLIDAVYPANWNSKRFVKGVYSRNDNLKMQLDSRNHIDSSLIFRGDFEPHLSRFFRRTISERDTVLDIGANIGAHTLTFASAVGQLGRVLAFEPNPIVRQQLEANIALNNMANVCVYNFALGAEKEVLPLSVPKSNSVEFSNMGLASLVALETPHDVIQVEVRLLDDVVLELGLTRIDMIKIDVQGYEFQVLAGAKRSLDRFSPVVIFEWEPWAWEKAGKNLEDLTEMLGSLGYHIYELTENGYYLFAVADISEVASGAELVAIKPARIAGFPFRIR